VNRQIFGAALVAQTLACAVHAPHLPPPGTGELAFRLEWTGPADLDLHVRSPLGEEIWFSSKTSASGGALDRDCNATPETMCERPMENVFWATGGAPSGIYRYSVVIVNLHEATFPVTFKLRILRRGKPLAAHVGALPGFRAVGGPWEVDVK
jgi:hypothetical protein